MCFILFLFFFIIISSADGLFMKRDKEQKTGGGAGRSGRMLRSCKYCGRIHDSKFDCGKKPKREHDRSRVSYTVHRSNRWTELSRSVRDRDGYCCLVCLSGKFGTLNRITTDGVSVHHIVPIEENPELAYDDTNCITLCHMHHEMAEAGEIPRSELKALINPAR